MLNAHAASVGMLFEKMTPELENQVPNCMFCVVLSVNAPSIWGFLRRRFTCQRRWLLRFGLAHSVPQACHENATPSDTAGGRRGRLPPRFTISLRPTTTVPASVSLT